MTLEKENDAEVDVYKLLQTASEAKKKKERKQLLEALNVKEYFEEGSISINKRTCQGVECKLCIDECPTHALYWTVGEVQISEELCVFCTACVLSCIVDDCICVTRKRPSGEIEKFSTPKHVLILLRNIDSKKKIERINAILRWNREIRFPSRASLLSSLAKLRKQNKTPKTKDT
jgi:ferredoxin